MAKATLAELRAVTYKKRDSWWTVLFVDPLAIHLVRLADRLRWATPNRITLLAFVIGLASAGAFLAADPLWLIIGAVLYHLAFVLDCVDGKLARWQNSGSIIGGWLDFTLDQVRLVICAVALLGGQYLARAPASGHGVFLLMAALVVFLNMFRYFNGFLMERALFDLRDRLDPAGAGRRRAPSISDDDPTDQPDEVPPTPGGTSGARAGERTVAAAGLDPSGNATGDVDLVATRDAGLAAGEADLVAAGEAPLGGAGIGAGDGLGAVRDGIGAGVNGGGDGELRSVQVRPVAPVAGPSAVVDRSRIGRLRTWLTARRIRLNVYSGIEFQMVVLIAAPVAGAVAGAANGGGAGVGRAVLGVVVAACAVMVAFELAQTGRFLRAAGKLLRAIGAAAGQVAADRPGDGEVPVQRPADPAETDPTQR